MLAHPPHSLDLAPSDFQLFGAQQDAIFGKKIVIDDEVTEEVEKFDVCRTVRRNIFL